MDRVGGGQRLPGDGADCERLWRSLQQRRGVEAKAAELHQGVVAHVDAIAEDTALQRSGHSVVALDRNVYVARGVMDDFTAQTNTFPEDVWRPALELAGAGGRAAQRTLGLHGEVLRRRHVHVRGHQPAPSR